MTAITVHGKSFRKTKNRYSYLPARYWLLQIVKNPKVKLAGLKPDKQYRDTRTGKIYGGDMLMYRGLKPQYAWKDFSTEVILFEMI